MNDAEGEMRMVTLLWVGAFGLSVSCGSYGRGPTGNEPARPGDDAGNGGDAAAAHAASGGPLADGSPDAAASPPGIGCASSSQLAGWVQEIDQFDGGYRPTGSAAHEGYIALLASELAALGVSDVHTEPYSFTRWAPSAWSLTLRNGASAGAVALSGYVPYSGATLPGGVTGGVVYLPASTIPLDPTALAGALQDPSGWNQSLAAAIERSLASLALAGKIVVFEVPRVSVALTTLTGPQVMVNDTGGTLAGNATVTRTDLSAMLVVPAMLSALAVHGTTGAVGILDEPEEAARGEYAPFFGALSPDLPAVYVDRD
ncbi:MAG: hypothetical protein ACRELB_09505, partial [Polyangiaceae bacterium]